MTGKLWIFFVLCIGCVVAQDDDSMELGGWNYDEWFDEVEDHDKLEGAQKNSKEDDYNNYEDADFDTLFKDVKEKPDDFKPDNLHNDYQIEDNRSAPIEGEQIAPLENHLENENDHLDIPETSVEEKIQDAAIAKEKEDEIPAENQQLGQDEKEVNEQEVKEVNEQEAKEDQEPFVYVPVPESDLRAVPEVSNVVDAPVIEDVVAKSDDEPQDENVAADSSQDNSKSLEISFETNSDLKPVPLPPVGVIDEEMKKIIAETQDILREEQGVGLEDKIALEMPMTIKPSDSEIDNIDTQLAPESAAKETDETQPLLSETDKFLKELDDTPLSAIDDVLKTVDETQQLLSEIDKIAKDDVALEPEAPKGIDELKNEPDFADLDEDTVDKVYKDLNEDLDKLLGTWRKLAMGGVGEEPNPDDSINFDNIADYEEKNGRPFREGLILSQRDDYYDDEKNNDNEAVAHAEEKDAKAIDQDQEKISDDKVKVSQEILDEERQDIVDAPAVPITEVPEKKEDDQDPKMLTEDFSIDNRKNIDDEKVKPPSEPLNDNADVEKKEEEINLQIFAVPVNSDVDNVPEIPYLHDAIPAKENEELEMDKKAESIDDEKVPTKSVADLRPQEYDQIMAQFKIAHGDELDVDSDTSRTREVKDPIKLSMDEIKEVTSTNYPAMYPTGTVTDWVLEGDGMGIEFNITDLFVNGVNGDYLLVKPGGVDESGHDGLLFSYRLSSRMYRFLDVDRLFVRFVTNPSFWGNFRGFKFSARMVAPAPRMDEEIPEPEPIVPEVKETHVVYLDIGSRSLAEFEGMAEQFRAVIVNMATMYIHANNIPMGINTTAEVTQLTHIGVCHLAWPGASRCARVTFAVPLVYEDDSEDYRLNQEQLEDMWDTYSIRDPFATMLSRMEISEFVPPNERGLLAVWSMIGAGVMVCVFMIGLVLWRYRAFDKYSRMPEPSDAGSLYSKKPSWELYPTPHQSLPALRLGDWPDQDDTTRVDMGGFTNKSYVREGEFDSDDESLSRDGNTIISGSSNA